MTSAPPTVCDFLHSILAGTSNQHFVEKFHEYEQQWAAQGELKTFVDYWMTPEGISNLACFVGKRDEFLAVGNQWISVFQKLAPHADPSDLADVFHFVLFNTVFQYPQNKTICENMLTYYFALPKSDPAVLCKVWTGNPLGKNKADLLQVLLQWGSPDQLVQSVVDQYNKSIQSLFEASLYRDYVVDILTHIDPNSVQNISNIEHIATNIPATGAWFAQQQKNKLLNTISLECSQATSSLRKI